MIVAAEVAVFAFFIVALVLKIIERIKETKKDKYKDVKY